MQSNPQQLALSDTTRLDRVLALRKALNEGSYSVSAIQLADAMLRKQAEQVTEHERRTRTPNG